VYPEAWKAQNKDGLRLHMPDKVTHTKNYTWNELVNLAAETYKNREDYALKQTDDGITITWTDWPKEELRLRRERCPYCFLDWSQEYGWNQSDHWIAMGHLKGCPNGGRRDNEENVSTAL